MTSKPKSLGLGSFFLFKWGFGEGFLKDKFAFSRLLKSYTRKEKSASLQNTNFHMQKGPCWKRPLNWTGSVFPLLIFNFYRVTQEPNRNREPEPSEPLFPKPKAEPEPPEPFSRNRNRNQNRPFLLNRTETQKTLFCRGTAGTENRNCSNRSTPEP